MRAVVQRVTSATVTVAGEAVGAIGAGLCVLVGVTHDDTEREARKLAEKLWHLRVMEDAAGVMNVSVADTTRTLLVVSQFTIYGDTSAGRRPSWIAAARPEHAEPLVDAVIEHLRILGGHVETGSLPDRHAGGARERRPGHTPGRGRPAAAGAGADVSVTRFAALRRRTRDGTRIDTARTPPIRISIGQSP